MPNNQLFRKIRLAFDLVFTPLKSELNFGKLLIINDLVKFDSLQTLFFATRETTSLPRKCGRGWTGG